MNKQLSLEGLKEFVSKQPADKPIDHGNHVGWCGCAVGAYVKTELGKPVDNEFDIEVQFEAKNFMRDSTKVPKSLERILAIPFRAELVCPTYGAMNKLLEGYTVVESLETA